MVNEVEFLNSFKIKTGFLTGLELSERDPLKKFKSFFIIDNEEINVDKLFLYQMINDSVLYDIGTNLELAKEIANSYEGLSSEEINELCNGKTINEIGLPVEVKHYLEMYEDRQELKNNPDLNLVEKYLNSGQTVIIKEAMLESIKEQLSNFKGANKLQLFNDKYRTLFYFFRYYNIPVEELVEKLEQDLLRMENN